MLINRLPLFLFLSLFGLIHLGVNADGITSIAKTNKLIKKAGEAYKAKNFKTAIEHYEAALKETTDLPEEVAFNLGNAYLETKQFPKASKYFTTSAAISRSAETRSKAYQQIGNIHSQQADYKLAMEFYKKSLKNNPKNQDARRNYEMAWHLNKKKEQEQAKNRENPKNPEEKKEPKKEENKPQNNQKQGGDKNQPEEKKEQQQAKNETKPGSKQDTKGEKKPGKEGQDKNAETRETNEKGDQGNQEQEDADGKEKSKSKGQESNMDDLNAIKIDKKKLLESGLSEEQAKSLLQAMRNSEVKYLQQRRFGSKKSRESDDKPRW